MKPTRVVSAVAVLAALVAGAACRGPAGEPGAPGSPGPTPSASPTGSTAPTPVPSPGAGLAVVVQNAWINEGVVSVDFTVSDLAGTPRTMDGVSCRWTLAAMSTDPNTGDTSWTNYFTKSATGAFGTTAQPTYDSAGTYEAKSPGVYRYTFSKQAPAGYDPTTTHRIALWATMGTDVSNDAWDFVPAGGAPSTERDLVSDAACNSCHADLSAHGGSRKQVELCATCHTPQLFDPDTQDPATPGGMNPLNLAVFVHRLHDGTSLPSIAAAQAAGIVGAKYDVIGYGNSDNVYAETITRAGSVVAEGVGFPQAVTNCATCHQGSQGVTGWTTASRRDTCGSCHDTTWFGDPNTTPPGMVDHTGGPVANDATCAICHVPSTGNEYDISVTGAHVTPVHSTQLKGLVAKIDSVALVTGSNGQTPVVTFEVRNGDGGVINPLTSPNLASLSMVLVGPSGGDDYLYGNMQSASIAATAVFDSSAGTYTATFPKRASTDPYWPNGAPIPPGSTGTWAVGLQGTRSASLVGLTGTTTVTEAAFNPVSYFSVDGSPVAKRRMTVSMDKCNVCHDRLAVHGGGRQNTEYCVVCHDPTATDWARRPKSGGNTNIAATLDGLEERSVNFKDLIHRIHTGEELAQKPYVVYGYGGSVNEFDGVKFPGDRANCETCHLPGTFTVDAIPPDAAPTLANETGTIRHLATAKHQSGEPTIPPVTAACLGCHATSDDTAHYAAMTVGGDETCRVCHSESSSFGVTALHQGK